MKRRVFEGEVITPVRIIAGKRVKAPSIRIGTDEVPPGRNQYQNAIKAAKEKSGLSRFKSWEFV